jgi:hypothetical protein
MASPQTDLFDSIGRHSSPAGKETKTPLSVHASQALDLVEVRIAAYQGQGMLPAERGNPQIVFRNRRRSLAQFLADVGIVDRCGVIHHRHRHRSGQTFQPGLTCDTVTGKLDAEAILTTRWAASPNRVTRN